MILGSGEAVKRRNGEAGIGRQAAACILNIDVLRDNFVHVETHQIFA